MQIILTALDDTLYQAWHKYCQLPNVTIFKRRILSPALIVDAVVSPANSYGIMDGGIDKIYSQSFPGIQKRVQAEIKKCGELGDPPGIPTHIQRKLRRIFGQKPSYWIPVGQAIVVKTGVEKPRYLIAAPTMEYPMRLSEDSDNAYRATKAALELVNDDWTIAFPGMGTGVGGLDPFLCSRQVAQAIQDVL